MRHFVKRIKFGAIAVWDGKDWRTDYTWDFSNCYDFGSEKAAFEFHLKCCFEDMASPLGGFSRFGNFKA